MHKELKENMTTIDHTEIINKETEILKKKKKKPSGNSDVAKHNWNFKTHYKGSTIDWVGRRISEFKKRSIKIMQPKEQTENGIKKKEHSLRERWDDRKGHGHMQNGWAWGEERGEQKNIFKEIMTFENFPNIMKILIYTPKKLNKLQAW